MGVILDWEKDLEYCEKVHNSLGKAFNMDDEDRRLHLIAMVPKDFGDYLLRESARYDTYVAVRTEIIEHIARSKRPAARVGVQALTQGPEHDDYADNVDTLEGIEYLDDEARGHSRAG
jgi:hypothetical protein